MPDKIFAAPFILIKLFMGNVALSKAIIDNAIDGIITIDEFGIVGSINPSACKSLIEKGSLISIPDI